MLASRNLDDLTVKGPTYDTSGTRPLCMGYSDEQPTSPEPFRFALTTITRHLICLSFIFYTSFFRHKSHEIHETFSGFPCSNNLGGEIC